MKSMRHLLFVSLVSFALLINIGVMAISFESESQRAPSYHWYQETCVSGTTYKICYATGDLAVCSKWGTTDPDPKCPDSEIK